MESLVDTCERDPRSAPSPDLNRWHVASEITAARHHGPAVVQTPETTGAHVALEVSPTATDEIDLKSRRRGIGRRWVPGDKPRALSAAHDRSLGPFLSQPAPPSPNTNTGLPLAAECPASPLDRNPSAGAAGATCHIEAVVSLRRGRPAISRFAHSGCCGRRQGHDRTGEQGQHQSQGNAQTLPGPGSVRRLHPAAGYRVGRGQHGTPPSRVRICSEETRPRSAPISNMRPRRVLMKDRMQLSRKRPPSRLSAARSPSPR